MNDYDRVRALPGWQNAVAAYSGVFQQGLVFVLAHENEYNRDGTVKTEHDPNDPGGTTKYGIDAASHPGLSIEDMTLIKAVDSYHQDEWFRARGELLPDKLAIAHFDSVVNLGEHHASEMLQAAVGAQVDGSVGPKTLEAARNAPETALESLLASREAYYRRLRLFPRYGRGWIQRVQDLREYLT